MLLWRISNHSSLDGRGGLIADGRWHFQGTPVVYLAESPAGALVEVLVHLELDITSLPVGYKLLKIEAPSDLLPENLKETEIPSRWRGGPARYCRTGNKLAKARPSCTIASALCDCSGNIQRRAEPTAS